MAEKQRLRERLSGIVERLASEREITDSERRLA
jgi:hypothetical protein